MVAKQVVSVFLFYALLSLCVPAQGGKAIIIRCKPNFKAAEQMLLTLMQKNHRMPAGAVRGSFHDCNTFIKSRTGCNGSLRLRTELSFIKNRGLDKFINNLEPIVRKTCISYADGIQMAVEAAMIVAGGPKVHLGRNRKDSIEPDPFETELPGLWPMSKLKELYMRKGFNVREMVVSNVGGHALGEFFGRKFSPNPSKFDHMFAVNLLHVLSSGSSLNGYNTLFTDRGFVKNEETLLWVKFYGDSTKTNGVSRGLVRLKQDFGKFLVKQASLH